MPMPNLISANSVNIQHQFKPLTLNKRQESDYRPGEQAFYEDENGIRWYAKMNDKKYAFLELLGEAYFKYLTGDSFAL